MSNQYGLIWTQCYRLWEDVVTGVNRSREVISVTWQHSSMRCLTWSRDTPTAPTEWPEVIQPPFKSSLYPCNSLNINGKELNFWISRDRDLNTLLIFFERDRSPGFPFREVGETPPQAVRLGNRRSTLFGGDCIKYCILQGFFIYDFDTPQNWYHSNQQALTINLVLLTSGYELSKTHKGGLGMALWISTAKSWYWTNHVITLVSVYRPKISLIWVLCVIPRGVDTLPLMLEKC